MNSTNPTGGGFGRRVVQSDSRDLTLVPEVSILQGSQVNLSGRDNLKERVRSALMQRIDPAALNEMEELANLADQRADKVSLLHVNVEIYKVLKLAKLSARFNFRT